MQLNEGILNNKRICCICGSDKTYINQWYNHNDKWHCKKCNNSLFTNPKHHPITNPRKIKFKDKFVMLKENPRKGVCCKCNKIGLTHIHHTEYDDNNPLKNTIELCPSCHMKESWKLKQIKREK